MKIAVLSDIHGNIDALKAVVKQMEEQDVEVLFSLGDQLGYYYAAIEVYEQIRKWKHYLISGNHERIFLNFLKGTKEYRDNITAKYGSSFLKYEKEFNQGFINEIASLKDKQAVQLDSIKFLLCHGSPWNRDQYLYPDASVDNLEKSDIAGYDFILIGHTHYPMIHKGKNGILINVGSVGQSRLVGGIANWGIINTENEVFTPMSTPYDIAPLEERLIRNNENEYLYKILRRNNFIK